MQHTKSISLFLIFLISSLSVTSVETTQYDVTYDNNGNLVQGPSIYQEYDELNRLVRVRDGSISGQLIESYTYDDGTQRLTKTNHILNETTYYISDEFVEVRNETGTYLTVYAYDGNTLLGRKDPDNTLSFYHPDHLGSTDLMTDASKNVVEQTTYDPYGRVRDGGETSDFLYTGKEKDDSGLYYYEARYYDPFFMRFTQADKTIPNIYNSQYLNRYLYVLGNPYKFVDPSGNVVVLMTGAFHSQEDMRNLQSQFYSSGKFTQSNLPSRVFNYGSGAKIDTTSSRDYIQTQLQENPNQPVVIVGHSWGGRAAIPLAQDLIDQGITDAKNIQIITIDPGAGISGSTKIPEGVDAVNFYNNNPYGIEQLEGATNIHRDESIGHTELDQDKIVTDYTVARTQELHGTINNKNTGSTSSGRGGPNDPNRGLRASNRNRRGGRR